MAKERIITSLDIGTSKIRTVVAVAGSNPEFQMVPNVIGVGVSPSLGIRKGQVIDIEELIHNIIASLEDAERMAGVPINHVFASVSGSHLESFDSKGVIAISSPEISNDDISRVLEAAQAVNVPSNRSILHIEPKMFSVDEQAGVKNPMGMTGIRLEVAAHIITGLLQNVKNLEKAIDQSGIDIDALVPATVAIAESVLSKRQRELGVAVIDVGAGCTKLAVYEEGSILHSASIPVAGESVTSDIAIGLRTSLETAEKIKIEHGSLTPVNVAERDMIEIAETNGADTQNVSKRYMCEIMEARYTEIFSMVNKELEEIGRAGMLPGGVVLTGAAMKAPGALELARDTLGLPVQLGYPSEIGGVIEKVDDPAYATVLGTIVWGLKEDISRPAFSGKISLKNLSGNARQIGGWLKSLLP